MKNGDIVWCWNANKEYAILGILIEKDYLTGYYLVKTCLKDRAHGVSNVELYRPIRKVKDPVSIMKHLTTNNYKFDPLGYYWYKPKCQKFFKEMWAYCGEEPPDNFDWEEEWLEYQ